MKLPTASESFPVPSCSNQQGENCARLSYIPGPLFDAGYFDLGMGRGPVARDSRLRNEHPINICSQLIPMVDKPMSPPQWTNTQQATGERLQNLLRAISNNARVEFTLKDQAAMTTLTSRAAQTASFAENLLNRFETVIDYLHKTAVRRESPEQFNARRLAILEGMKVGSFMLIAGGVSQASACDGNMYSICHDYQNALPSTIPLN